MGSVGPMNGSDVGRGGTPGLLCEWGDVGTRGTSSSERSAHGWSGARTSWLGCTPRWTRPGTVGGLPWPLSVRPGSASPAWSASSVEPSRGFSPAERCPAPQRPTGRWSRHWRPGSVRCHARTSPRWVRTGRCSIGCTGREAPVGREDRPWVVAETLLRVLRMIGRDGAGVVVLEDVHWSDPDTLGVVEYMADNLDREPCLLVLTPRGEPGPAHDVLERLARQGSVGMIRLGRLPDRSVAEMAAACLGHPPGDDVRELLRRAQGTPLMVEELLASPGPAWVTGQEILLLVGDGLPNAAIATRLPGGARRSHRCTSARSGSGRTSRARARPGRPAVVSRDRSPGDRR